MQMSSFVQERDEVKNKLEQRFQIVPLQILRLKRRANFPFTLISSGPSRSKPSVTVTGFPGLPLLGAFLLLPFGSMLASGQWSPFCPISTQQFHVSSPLLGRVCWAFLQSPGLLWAGWFLCVVFVVWVVCIVKPPQGQSGSLHSHLEPLHLPCHLLPLPNFHFI